MTSTFVWKALPQQLAAGQIDLTEAETTAVLGPNGSGKTSLLRTLAGLAGNLTAGPTDHCVYLPAGPLEPTDLPLLDLVLAGAAAWNRPWGHWSAEERQRALDLLDHLEASHLAHKPYGRLSLGERRLGDLARTFFTQRTYLLFDEPTANLDLRHRLLFWQLAAVHRATGGRIIAALHDPSEALEHAGRALLLQKGQLVADTTPAAALTPDLLAQVWQVEALPKHLPRFVLQKLT